MEAAGNKCFGVVLVLVFVLGLGEWVEGCWEQEKIALLQLKPFFSVQRNPFNDINRYSLYDWVEESSDCCQWERVECDATSRRVTGLSLADISIGGDTYLNASLFLPFKELKSLSLSENNIAGCLDNEGFEKLALKLKKLEILDLSFNRFNDSSILSSLVEISSLKSLNLSGNRLGGLPTKLSGVVEILDLKKNELDNNILMSLSELSSLKYLDLSNNNINGSIHNNDMKNLTNLKELDLSYNEIKSLDFFSGLINLEVLTLSLNDCDNNNNILSSLGPFSKCLKHLYIDNNYQSEGSIDIKDARDLKNLNGVATNNRVLHLLQQLLDLLPSLKTLFFDSCGSQFNEETVHGVLQLKNLESLKINGTFPQSSHISTFPLQDSFFENIGRMTSLKILSLPNCGLNGTLSTQGICQLRLLEELDISGNMLKGVLPDCLSNLTFLQHLDLSYNQFYGILPDCVSNLKFLQHLDLSYNQFYGNLLAISPLQSLTYIDLSYNQFQIPISLNPFFNHSKLKYFNGDYNNIYEETELHSLVPRFQLNVIRLSCCGDVGPLPKFLHHQHELQSVQLSNINLTGEFPSWLLENNTKLKTLFLINNSFSGSFRLPFHPLMKLLELDVSNNFIDGHIPVKIGVYLPSLMILNISENHLDGSIPSSIGDMKLLEILDLSNNKLSGVIPENLVTGCSSLKTLVLSNNRLHGQIFSENFNLTNLSKLYLAGNNFRGSVPEKLPNCSFLRTIDIGYNHLSGRIPRWMGNLPLLEIIMPANHFEGPIPIEFCQLDIRVLDLSVNSISGTLPSCFGQGFLKHVHLSKNRLQGPIPNGICKSSGMVTLDLSDNQLTGNIPNCIGDISDLSYLVLNHNNFGGEIPTQLCQLNKLSLIDLSHNNLSGRIPNCLNFTTYEEASRGYPDCNQLRDRSCIIGPFLFGKNASIEMTTKSIPYLYKESILRYLSGIDFSSNKLIGHIPHEMGNLHKIITLNLSHNSLAGQIPPSLSNLKEVESLDLSYNNLSGSIPFQLTELSFLAYFNVSYNNLSGKPPPRTKQFASNFDENSYWGNPFLCGEPLPKNCSTAPNQPAEDGQDDEEGGLIDIESFFVTFTVAYIMVLLCIVLIMYINPYWRRVWFYFLERSIISCFYFVIDNLPAQFRCGNI